jgi:hypothetical protein
VFLGLSGDDLFECYKNVYVAVKSVRKTTGFRASFIEIIRFENLRNTQSY